MVNQYYFYAADRDFGPFFLKFSSYFPYNGRLCLNGHEYAKRQLQQCGIDFEPLDNGFLTCAAPEQLQVICDGLSAAKIDGLARKWLARLPHLFTPEDRTAGYRYDISILQAEFALTQALDRPLSGRILFEDIIRENLDLGRPDQVQLIFNCRVTKRTPGRFRTRIYQWWRLSMVALIMAIGKKFRSCRGKSNGVANPRRPDKNQCRSVDITSER